MYTRYKTEDLDLPGFSNIGQISNNLLLGQRPLDYEDARKLVRENIRHMIKRSLNTEDPVEKYINPSGVFDDLKIVNAFQKLYSRKHKSKNLSGIAEIFPKNSLLLILIGLAIFFLVA